MKHMKAVNEKIKKNLSSFIMYFVKDIIIGWIIDRTTRGIKDSQ